MPGTNGPQVARAILNDALCGSPKIIANTASALSSHEDEARASGCVDFIAKPFDCEKLYECLERHLGVVMERESCVGKLDAATSVSLERVALPDKLCARLTVAAELHSTTALKACLPELRAVGPAGLRLAEEIRLMMRSYDMDGVQRLLADYVVRLQTAETDPQPHVT